MATDTPWTTNRPTGDDVPATHQPDLTPDTVPGDETGDRVRVDHLHTLRDKINYIETKVENSTTLPTETLGSHSGRHESGGDDEIDISGLPADVIKESGGQSLTLGAVADGEVLTRSGTTLVGSAGGGSGPDLSDATPEDLGTAGPGTDTEASRSDHVHANPKLDDLESPDDNTDLNATTGAHGLLPKLGGGTTNYLRADGTWAEPAGGGGGPTPLWEWNGTDFSQFVGGSGGSITVTKGSHVVTATATIVDEFGGVPMIKITATGDTGTATDEVDDIAMIALDVAALPDEYIIVANTLIPYVDDGNKRCTLMGVRVGTDASFNANNSVFMFETAGQTWEDCHVIATGSGGGFLTGDFYNSTNSSDQSRGSRRALAVQGLSTGGDGLLMSAYTGTHSFIPIPQSEISASHDEGKAVIGVAGPMTDSWVEGSYTSWFWDIKVFAFPVSQPVW
jgi:hypothetical protein